MRLKVVRIEKKGQFYYAMLDKKSRDKIGVNPQDLCLITYNSKHMAAVVVQSLKDDVGKGVVIDEALAGKFGISVGDSIAVDHGVAKKNVDKIHLN